MISDATVQVVLDFRRDRDWEQFHSPKNLAIALAVEAGELLEEFQWTTDHQQPRDLEHGKSRIVEEMADLAILLTYMAHDLGVDLDQAVNAKVALNRDRYPVERSRGNAAKYDEL